MAEQQVITYSYAENFVEVDRRPLLSAEAMTNNSIFMDMRNKMQCAKCDFESIDWYVNYLNTNANFASKNPDAYCSYLLQIGYIPIVFVPSFLQEAAVTFQAILDRERIPYFKYAAMSFTLSRVQLDVSDCWVSKLDIERLLNIPIRDIRSSEVARRLFA